MKVGDPMTLEYFAWEEPGRLVTRTADFEIAAIVPIAGAAADRDLAPVYPGISDTSSLRDWDPPFPIDLRRVRRVDEDYWESTGRRRRRSCRSRSGSRSGARGTAIARRFA